MNDHSNKRQVHFALVPFVMYRIFSIKLWTPNKRRVFRSEFKTNAPGVYSGSRRLFEMGMLNQDYMAWLHTSSLSTIIFNLYTTIQTKLPFTEVLLTKTDETNDSSGIVSIPLKSWQLFCGLVHQARIISRVSPGYLQQFLAVESFHNFAFLRTNGEDTSPPPCWKLLAQQFAVEQLPIHFLRVSCMEKRNVEKSSITVSVVFFTRFTYTKQSWRHRFTFFKRFCWNLPWLNKLSILKNAFNK